MKPSILQLEEILFVRTRIDIDPEYEGDDGDFSFEGAKYRWSSRMGHRNDDSHQYWVGLDYGLNSTDEKRCPYIVDMKVVGFFNVRDSVPEEKRDSLVYENGSALVFGAIREMIATITSRSLYGTLLLPTASFVNTYPTYVEKQAARKAKEAEALSQANSTDALPPPGDT